MAKTKKRRGPPQKTKTSYAEELQRKKELGYEIIQDWSTQLAVDTMMEILNDPEVMGHNAMGAVRLERVCIAFMERWPDRRVALSSRDEADYVRVKMDETQKRIFGENYPPWHLRYRDWDQNDTY